MSYQPMIVELAREHTRDLHAEACRRRLARIASCCKPSYVAARLARLRERLAHRHSRGLGACCS